MTVNSSTSLTAHFVSSVRDVPDALWTLEHMPFGSRVFWTALENCGAVSAQSGWLARHMVLFDGERALAFMPLFVKNHHRGEYVFDQGWASAHAEHGLDYYPRLVSSVPFTPVVGARVWLAAGVALSDVAAVLMQAVRELAERVGASSWHGLFIEPAQVEVLNPDDELALRHGCQFLWRNADYADFDGFLNALTTKRRKSIRAERRKVAEQGIRAQLIEGADITEADWLFFYQCYQRTYAVRGQTAYLPFEFFQQIGVGMADNLLLIVACDAQGNRLAAALFFKDATTLYGRYWGAVLDIDCLHFELCYYQGIEYAIAQGLQYFDPGTQGEHKLTRGFAPVITQSLHWLRDARFMDAVQRHVARERVGMAGYFDDATAILPYRETAIKPPAE